MNKAQRMMSSFQARVQDDHELVKSSRLVIWKSRARLAALSVGMFLYRRIVMPMADHSKEIGSIIVAIAMVILLKEMLGF